MADINDLLKGGGGVDVARVIKGCARKRQEHRYWWDGYTKDRSMRLVAEIPMKDFLRDGEIKKYFASGMDKHERKKNLEAFLKKYKQFMTVDRYGPGISI